MKRRIEFNMRELAGSMGDFGTLFPLAVGYIAICGMDPVGILVMIGLANIATGIIYRLPMPIEPMKVIAITAIAQRWEPELVYATGIATGLIWLTLSITGVMDRIARAVPDSVVKGIQIGLGLLLSIEALNLMGRGWLLGIVSLTVIILLKDSRKLPAGIVLIGGGIAIMYLRGDMAGVSYSGIKLPEFGYVSLSDMWKGMVLAGFAQIPLTATNAVIATSSLLKEYWPDSEVTERQLALDMGVMNMMLPLFGGMPLCHGAGGLAGQHAFGARTGGTNIIEGVVEILLGLFLGSSIALIFSRFPKEIVGAMMLFVGYKLVNRGYKAIRKGAKLLEVFVVLITAILAAIFNMAIGFAVGMATQYLIDAVVEKRRK